MKSATVIRRYLISSLVLCLIGLSFIGGYYWRQQEEAAQSQILPSPVPSLPVIEVCFSPQQNCEAIIVKEINKARESIYIQAYSFTSTPIIDALIKAHWRKVDVKVILDGKTKLSEYLLASPLPLYIEKMPGLAHNKIIIIDRGIVFGGSYNFTKAARYRNAENLTKIESTEVVQEYLNNWEFHLKRSQLILQN